MKRPDAIEYPAVYGKYVDLVHTDDVLAAWDDYTEDLVTFFEKIGADKHDYRYAAGKWTVKDVLQHIIDTERGYSYRAIMCVRGDHTTPLYPMDENLFADNADTSGRTITNLVEEFRLVRAAFRRIFDYTTEEQQGLMGNGVNGGITGRALAYIAIGHAIHHQQVVQERYL